MAKVSLDAVEQFQEQTVTSNQVSFFSLKNDNDEAIVRFMYDDISEFEILTFHSITVTGTDGRSRDIKVGCTRDLNESPDKCPLCQAGNKLMQRFFIKMLQYVNDGSGNVVVKPVVWERSTQYALKLREYLNNYGPLSDVICKIIRHGAAGSMQTTYEIVPNLNKNIYPDNVYVKDTSVISKYEASGNLVQERSAEDLYTYLQTGQLPQKKPIENQTNGDFSMSNSQPPVNSASPQIGYSYPGPANDFTSVQQQAQAQVVQQTVTQTPIQQIPQPQMPWQQNNSGIQRPIRTY